MAVKSILTSQTDFTGRDPCNRKNIRTLAFQRIHAGQRYHALQIPPATDDILLSPAGAAQPPLY